MVTKQEALIIIGSDIENANEAVLVALFEHKNFLLKSVIVPQVFKTRGRKIETLSEACMALEITDLKNKVDFSEPNLFLDSFNVMKLLNFYRSYESQVSSIKLILMQNNDASVVSKCCFLLAQLEHLKMTTISKLIWKEYALNLEEIKISEFVNSGEIIKELKKTTANDINLQNIYTFPTLIKEMIRSRKYDNLTNQKEVKNA